MLSASLGTTLEAWEPQAASLAGPFRVVRYDRRGHGASEVPPGPYSLDDLGRDALELLDELELERASWCGLSLGGLVGMWLAAEAPERIDRLVLACTAAAFLPREQWLERAERVRAEGVAAIADAVVARWFTSGAPVELVDRFREQLAGTPAEGYAGCCEALADADLAGRLEASRRPDARPDRLGRPGRALPPTERRSRPQSRTRATSRSPAPLTLRAPSSPARSPSSCSTT